MIKSAVVFATLGLTTIYISNCNALDGDSRMVDCKLEVWLYSTRLLLIKKFATVCACNCIFIRYDCDHEVLASVPNYCCHAGIFTYSASRHV